jgi:lysophospholipase L1-like esterase
VLVTIAGSLLFSLAIAEVILRLFPGMISSEIKESIQARPGSSGISHPYIGHLHKPNRNFTHVGRDFTAVHHTDGLGFRNPWPWPEKVDIVVLGDSVTFGQNVEDDQAWPAILARSLSRSRVINLGLIGSGPQQYSRVFETFGAELHPKLVVVGLFLRNDLWDDESFDAWLKSGAGGNYMVWRDFGRPKKVFDPEQPFKSAIRTTLWKTFIFARKSYLFNLILYAKGAARKWRPDEVRIFELPDGSRLELHPADFKRKVKGAHPGNREFQLTLGALMRVHSIAESHGAKTLVIFLPGKEEAYLPLLDGDVPDASRSLRQELAALEIPYLDLVPLFRDRAAKGEKLFFEADGHPNARGYALIAEGVISHLKSHGAQYGLTDWQTNLGDPTS